MEIRKKGDLGWKQGNRGDPSNLGIAGKIALTKLMTIFIVPISSEAQEDGDPYSTAHIERAYETSFVRRVQVPQ